MRDCTVFLLVSTVNKNGTAVTPPMIYPSPPTLCCFAVSYTQQAIPQQAISQLLSPRPAERLYARGAQRALQYMHATYTHRRDLLHAVLSHRACPSSSCPTARSRPPSRPRGSEDVCRGHAVLPRVASDPINRKRPECRRVPVSPSTRGRCPRAVGHCQDLCAESLRVAVSGIGGNY